MSNGKSQYADTVMYSTGRLPYTWDIGLETAGIETCAKGAIAVDEFSTTSCDNIFAVGDVTNRVNLTPVAIQEGHAFADTVYGNNPRPSDHRYVASAVFSQPAIGTVGLTEQEARDLFDSVRIYKSRFSPMRHTLSGRNEKMMVKLIVDDATDQVVGCHIVGPDAAEILQGFAVAVKAGLTKAQFDATIGIHPTSAEELVTLRVAISE
jgi:glutathione reductase (NADPH)